MDRATTDAFRHSGFIFSDVRYLIVSASDSLAVFLYRLLLSFMTTSVSQLLDFTINS